MGPKRAPILHWGPFGSHLGSIFGSHFGIPVWGPCWIPFGLFQCSVGRTLIGASQGRRCLRGKCHFNNFKRDPRPWTLCRIQVPWALCRNQVPGPMQDPGSMGPMQDPSSMGPIQDPGPWAVWAHKLGLWAVRTNGGRRPTLWRPKAD